MKLKRCPNMHYYDADKYPQCPHCAALAEQQAPQPVTIAAPQPEPVAAPQPEPVAAPQPEPVAAPQPEPAAAPLPEPAAAPQAESEPVSDGAWRCVCGTVVVGNFCMRCGHPRITADAVQAEQPAPEPVPVQPVQPAQEPSLTSYISEVNFTGNLEDAKEKAASQRDDEGATQIIFDELADDLILGWLVAVSANIKGKVFAVTDTKSTIGRSDAEHPVTIDLHGDKTVSRGAQAVLLYDPLNKKFFLQSTDSKTFIYVNRQMLLMPAELKIYDRIMLGETELLFIPLCSEQFSW